MKEEALKLADELLRENTQVSVESAYMIRRLVEELDRLDYDLKSLANRYKALDRTKPLSDEEIWELHQEHIDEIPCGHSMKTIGFVEFARAILRKAQEK